MAGCLMIKVGKEVEEEEVVEVIVGGGGDRGT